MADSTNPEIQLNKVIKGAGTLTGIIGSLVASILATVGIPSPNASLGKFGKSRPKLKYLREAQLPARTVTPKMKRVQGRKAAQAQRTAAGQQPKAGKAPRQRRAATPKHDTAGFAITLVGREPRRVWLGGISAQRGF